MLGYRLTQMEREDPEEKKRELENDPSVQLSETLTQTSTDSLQDMEAFMRKFCDQLQFYSGDGFAYVVFGDDILFDDYRTGDFYSIYGKEFISSCERRPLDPDATPEKWQELSADIGAAAQPAQRDYATMMTDGRLDLVKQVHWLLDSDWFRSQTYPYCFWAKDQRYSEDVYDQETMDRLLDFTRRQTFVETTWESRFDLSSKQTYRIVFLAHDLVKKNFEFYIGKDRGKPFLYFAGCVAAISEQEYDEWFACFERLNVPPEKRIPIDRPAAASQTN